MRSDVKALPAPFLERLRRIVPSGRFDALANTFARPKPTTFRANTLKGPAEQIAQELSRLGFRLERVAWYPDALILRHGSLRQLQQTDLYLRGALYVQSLSSMVPPLALDPQPGELVLDLAAAPGSKTTQLVCLMRGRGRLVANDSHRLRFFKLKANVEQQGALNVELSLRPGEWFGRAQPQRFDRVLVDAPCSAEGRFQTREASSFCYWKPAKIREMVRKQKRLLASAIAAVRPGGVIVYATCTFAPEENEGVVSWALERFGDRLSVEPFRLPLANLMSGLSAWEGRRFPQGLRHTLRILPTDEMEGFYVARLRVCR